MHQQRGETRLWFIAAFAESRWESGLLRLGLQFGLRVARTAHCRLDGGLSSLRFRCRSGLVHVDLALGAHDLLAANSHDLVLNDLVADKAHELDILRRSTEYPFFIFGVAIALADLLIRTSLRKRNQIAVHADEHAFIFERLSHFRWQGCDVGFTSRQRFEVEDGLKILLELLHVHIRDELIELHDQNGTAGIGLLFRLRRHRSFASDSRNRDPLVPLFLLSRTPIDFENYVL